MFIIIPNSKVAGNIVLMVLASLLETLLPSLVTLDQEFPLKKNSEQESVSHVEQYMTKHCYRESERADNEGQGK